MHRILYLAKVLRKCTGTGSKDGSEVSDKTKDTALYIIFAAIFVGMFFVGRMLGVWAYLLGEPISVFQSFFMLGAVVSILLTIPGMINTLYMSSDMGMLLTLPFTANEIVSARVINLLKLPVLISLVVTIAPGIGYFSTVGVIPEMLLAIIVAFVCMPVISLSALGIIVVLLMSVVKGLRSRDSLKIVGAIALIIVFAIYVFVVNSNYSEESVKQISQTVSLFDDIFPINFALEMLMVNASMWGVLISFGITAAFLIVFVLVVRKFYLAAALSMQDTAASYGVVSEREFAKIIKKKAVIRAVAEKELKVTSRNPAYLLTGYLYPIFVPLLTAIVLLFTGSNMISFNSGNTAVDTFFLFTIIVPLMVGMGVGTCAVVTTPVSREGEDFVLLRISPVKLANILKAKKIAGFIVGVGPTIVIIVIGGAILVPLYGLQFWGIIYGVALAALLGMAGVNACMTRDLKNPNLVWDNEAQMIKSAGGATAIIYLVLCIAGGMALAILGMAFEWVLLFAAAAIVLSLISALLTGMKTKKWAGKVAAQLHME